MLKLKNLILIAFAASIFAYGIGIFFYFIGGIAAFVAGFLIFLPDVNWAPLKQKIRISHGLVQADVRGLTFDKKIIYSISGCSELDVVLDQIIEHLLQDYIYYWYSPLTNESEFPKSIRFALAQFLSQCSERIKSIDWIPFIIEEIPTVVIDHLKIQSKALDRQFVPSSSEFVNHFFNVEAETEKNICREDISTSIESELEYLRRLTDLFLYAVMPADDYRVSTYRYLIKEVIVNGVLMPTINILADPDFVNQSVINLCNESACTSPYFIHSLRMSNSKAELKVVMEKIKAFSIKLRGRDSGNNNDKFVKAQLSSLNYIEKVCKQRFSVLKKGIYPKAEHAYNGMSSRVLDLTFDDVIASDVAVTNFLDFLTSINEQTLFSLYLNCVAFRVNADELMASTNSTDIGDETEDSVFRMVKNCDDELLTKSEGSISFIVDSPPSSGSPSPNSDHGSNESPTPITSLSNPIAIGSKTGETFEGVRAFGVSMCNQVMRTMPGIPEETVHKCLRNLTTNEGSIDSNVFMEIEEQLVRILSDDNCFGAFKLSPYYTRTLDEIELPETISDSARRSKASCLNSNQLQGAAGTHTTQSQLKIPDVINKSCTSTNSGLDADGTGLSLYSQDGAPIISVKRPHSPPSQQASGYSGSGSPHADTYSITITSAEMVRDGYVVYTIEVVCVSSVSGRKTNWRIFRRFSHFDDLNSLILEQCGRIPSLKLPSKKSFSSVNREFIERRRADLENYLQTLCSLDANGRYAKIHPFLLSFLQQENWEKKNSTPAAVSSIVNPLKSVGSAILSVPDSLNDVFSKMMHRRTPSNASMHHRPGLRASQADIFNAPSTMSVFDQMDSENIPFTMLFTLVDEIFRLQDKTQPFRRGTLSILRNIVQTFFGDIMSRKLIEKATNLISAKAIAGYAEMLRDVLWPNGWGEVSSSCPSNDVTDASVPTTTGALTKRDDQMKLRTQVLCRAVMLGSVAEELAQYLGIEATRDGVQRVFTLMQEPCLNRRIVHILLEKMLRKVLSDKEQQLTEIIQEENCPANTSRICSLHTHSM